MSLFDSLFGWTKLGEWTKNGEYKAPAQPMFTTVTITPVEKPKKPRKARAKKVAPEPVAEPIVEQPVAEKSSVKPDVKVLKLDFDPSNPRVGSMELDWNQEFIALLREHGYAGNSDEDLVDAWMNDICRNILMNEYPGRTIPRAPVQRRDLGDGKTEVS